MLRIVCIFVSILKYSELSSLTDDLFWSNDQTAEFMLRSPRIRITPPSTISFDTHRTNDESCEIFAIWSDNVIRNICNTVTFRVSSVTHSRRVCNRLETWLVKLYSWKSKSWLIANIREKLGIFLPVFFMSHAGDSRLEQQYSVEEFKRQSKKPFKLLFGLLIYLLLKIQLCTVRFAIQTTRIVSRWGEYGWQTSTSTMATGSRKKHQATAQQRKYYYY